MILPKVAENAVSFTGRDRVCMNSQMKADMMLLLVVMAWGFSFLMLDMSAEVLGAFTLNSWRFLIAFAVAAVVAAPRLRGISRITLKYSLLIGVIMVSLFTALTFGMQNTVLQNAGFLCGLTVLFTPILSSIAYRRLPDRKLGLVALMCVAGIALLTLTESFTINYENLPGDLLCSLCAFLYAIHLLVTEKAVKTEGVDAFQLGVLQLGVTGLCSLALALCLENVTAPPTPKIWGAVLFLAIVCTGMAFIIQTVAQKYTTASHVGVINCLETVFAGIVAYVFGGSEFTPKAIAGALLIVLAIFVMEIDFGRLFRKRETEAG